MDKKVVKNFMRSQDMFGLCTEKIYLFDPIIDIYYSYVCYVKLSNHITLFLYKYSSLKLRTYYTICNGKVSKYSYICIAIN